MIKKYFHNNLKPLLFLFLTWGTYLTIMWIKMLYFDSQGNLVAGWRIIWADWAMHIGQIHAFYHNSFWQVISSHPLYAGLPLRYSFVTNLLSALLMRSGLNLIQATIIPSIVFSFLLLISLFYFLKQLTQDNHQIILTIFIFLLGGGLGFYHFLIDLSGQFSFSKFIFPPTEYTRIESLGYYWYNPIVASFIPQRSLLLGMPIALFILGTLYRFYQKDFKIKKIKQKIFYLGLLSGLLTFIHFHSLIFLFLICFFLFIFDICLSLKSTQNLKNILTAWIIYAFSSLLSALPFILLLTDFNATSFIRFYPGWLANPQALNMPIIIFWLKNWGILIPLALGSIILFSKNFKFKLNLFILTFFLIFIICNLFIFQPYDWDNSKLLLWVYLIFSFLSACFILKLWRYQRLNLEIHRWQNFSQNKNHNSVARSYKTPEILLSAVFKSLAIILFIFLTFSGYLDLASILNTPQNSFIMISAPDIALADQYRQMTTYSDLAIISNTHLHWLPVFSGRRVFAGYNGWLWSWGIDINPRTLQISSMYQNTPEGKNLLFKNQIDYVVLDDLSRSYYWSDSNYFNNQFPKVLENQSYQVYKVTN